MMKPPKARRIPRRLAVHGDVRVDPYYWLRDRAKPGVLAYLKAENEYTAERMHHTEPLQETLYREMVGRIKETDSTVPERDGPYLYYSRTIKGKQYSLLCRKLETESAPEELLLDGNRLARGLPYFRLGVAEVSHDHRLLAYSVDDDGSETYTIRVKDLATGRLLRDVIPNTSDSLAWTAGNAGFFYTTLDETKRPNQVWWHQLGTKSSDDRLVFEESDPTFRVSVGLTRSRAYILVASESNTSTEFHFRSAGGGDEPFRVIAPRRRDVEYSVEHQGDHFWVRSNERGKNFELFEVPVSQPDRRHWRVKIRHRRNAVIEDVDAFAGHLVVTMRERGQLGVWIWDAKGGRHKVAFDEPVYTVDVAANPEYRTQTVRLVYSSLVTPRSVIDYDMESRQRQLRKRDEVLGGFDPENYRTERLVATAPDGVRVPISLVYRKGLRRNGQNPMVLYGYGSYGLSSDPRFNSDRVSLLDRGIIWAIAHIRGGGDVSRYWYEDGKKLKKRNTFTDFIACAEALVARQYTNPERLSIYGGSAGGLLVGAVVNMRPDLFHAAVARVPFVDVVTTMLDPTIPLTTEEYDEWGNPGQKRYYRYIKSYSPYDNVTTQQYPNLLVTAGLNDPRVGYWEPAKWVARLRERNNGQASVLLKTDLESGHGGPSGRYSKWREVALEYAFLVDMAGEPQPSSDPLARV